MSDDGFTVVVKGRKKKDSYSKKDYSKKDYSKKDYSKKDYSKKGYSKKDWGSKKDYSRSSKSGHSDKIPRDQESMMSRASSLTKELDWIIQDAISDRPYDAVRLIDLPDGMTEHEVEWVKEVYQMRSYLKVTYNLDEGTLTLTHLETDGGHARLYDAVYDAIETYRYSHGWLIDIPVDVTEAAIQGVRDTVESDKYIFDVNREDETCPSVIVFDPVAFAAVRS